MNPITLFLLISSFQGFVLAAIILFSPYFKSKANNYLGYSIIILSLLMFNIFLRNITVFDSYPKLRVLDNIEWVFIFPVVFFFYILNVFNNNLLKNPKIKWLYLPIIISIIINLVKNLERDYSLYTISFHSKDAFYNALFGFEELMKYVFNIILLTWSFKIIKKSSSVKKLNIKWVKNLWIFVLIMTLSWLALFLIDKFIVDYNPRLNHYIFSDIYILAVQLSVFVYWVAYNGLYKLNLANEQKEILAILNKGTSKSKEPITDSKVDNKKDKLISTNSFSEKNPYFLQLEILLEKNHVYRDPNLNRESVAEKIGISAGYLSQIVNSITGMNFATFVNSYRVKEAKRMLLDKQFDKYSLLSIGLESGFKSKATFYNSFKKETNCTPNQYKNKYKSV